MKGRIGWEAATWACALRMFHCYEVDEVRMLMTVNRPSLMGTHTGSQIADAGLQARVLDTIVTNATAIFDED